MSIQTAPLILEKLQAFARRRRRLIVRRGIYAAVATLLVAMMLVALVDWLFVLPDAARWALSGAAYLAILVVEWRSCWRLLLHAPGSRQLARLIEHAEPKLREDLLSAVELGDANSEAIFDSEQFRALVQSDVAARVEKLDMDRLLPARLLRRYTFIAAGIGLACLAAMALTGFQFGTLMMRALLPMANFARVSKVKVQIVEPSPAEMRVPQGDTLPLIIELSGRLTNKATLETFTPSGGREVAPMTPLDRNRFSATIQVGREDVFYRVRAGDAQTAKYRLEAVARPAVVEFQKSYSYPTYSKLEPKAVTEENGDLTALEGSKVELRMRTNQKVRDAELRIEQGKKNTVVPLVQNGDVLVATVPIDASGIYRVHLVGAESGFENKFSPEYELRAEPDLVPQVELELPKQDLILPSNEIVDVQGTASDDFALAKVAQLVKINDGPWKETLLGTGPGAKMKVERRWDLFEQGVKPGDLVTMKLAAVDLKGNRAESRPLQVTITAAGFEAKRLQALVGYRQLFESLKAAQSTATVLIKQAQEARQQFERLAEGDAQRIQVLAPVAAGLETFVQKHADAMKRLQSAIQEAVGGHETGDFALLGRAMVHADVGFAESARSIVGLLVAKNDLPTARDLLAEAQNGIARTDQIMRQLVEDCRNLLTAEEVDAFEENLQVVGQEQQRLLSLAHHSGTDMEKWAPVANRLRVVLSELRALEELAGAAVEHGSNGVPDRMRNLQKLLNKRRTTLETALAGKGGVELLGPTIELSQAIEDSTHQALDLVRDFRSRPVETLRVLQREAEPSYLAFEQLRQEVDRYFNNNKLPLEVGSSLIDGRWAARLDGWKSRGDIEEWRPDADSYFVNDVRLTSRVLQALRDRTAGQKPATWAKDLLGMDRNFRVLEMGHNLAELVDGTTRLAAAEHWEIYNPKSRTANPHDWYWLSERLRMMPDEIGRALDFTERRPLAQDAQKILREAQGQEFAHTLQREMDDRANITRMPVSVRDEADQLAAWLKQALELFREPMEEARKVLAGQAPTLADSMKQLAKKTDELKEKTTNQAQQVHEKLADEAKADARQALTEQQRLNEQVEALKDALRADANQQNPLEKEGRERARDADDAVAMLKEPPQRAQEDLELAAKSDKAATQEQALSQAAEQQKKLSEALQQMAEHYAALDKGKPDETRAAMRATEQQNGIKEQLDQQYAKTEQMAKLAQSTPEEMLAQLEKALPQNPHMQKELSGISQNTLREAADQLKQASDQEHTVAQNVQKQAGDEQAAKPQNGQQSPAGPASPAAPQTPAGQPAAKPNVPNGTNAPNAAQPNVPQNPPAQPGQPPAAPNQNNPVLAQAAEQQKPIGDAAAQAADNVQRAARHETRLDNKVAGEQLQQLGKQVEATAQQQVPDAKQALQQAQQAAQAQPAVKAANDGLQKSLGQLAAMANPAQSEAGEKSSDKGTPADAAAASAPTPGTPAANKGAQAETAGQPSKAADKASAQNNQAAAQPPAQNGQSPANQAGQQAQAAKSGQGEQAAPGNQAAAQAPGQNGQSPNSPAGQQAQAAKSGQGEQAGKGTPPAPGEESNIAAAPASPQEQVWMARTLDALDAALHTQAGNSAQDAKNGAKQAAQSSGKTSQAQQTSAAQSAGSKPAPQSNAMAQAQSAMNAAAQAAAAAARAARAEQGSPDQPGEPKPGDLKALSKGGLQDGAANGPHGPLADAKNKAGDWGKLPKQMAEQLTQGQREEIAGEYRSQVETYYRVIAEKSKKP